MRKVEREEGKRTGRRAGVQTEAGLAVNMPPKRKTGKDADSGKVRCRYQLPVSRLCVHILRRLVGGERVKQAGIQGAGVALHGSPHSKTGDTRIEA